MIVFIGRLWNMKNDFWNRGSITCKKRKSHKIGAQIPDPAPFSGVWFFNVLEIWAFDLVLVSKWLLALL